eukprot:scaffold88325_cov53-Cyclotella_meneghiniana.AAC.2
MQRFDISRKSLLSALPLLIIIATTAGATQVSWSGNNNVDPKHKAAHAAPRSQRYWDENNIERPDYAKTDAEIASERRRRGETSDWKTRIGTLMITVYSILGIAALMTLGYGAYTGDWSVITNNPVASFIDQCINRVLEAGGMSGQKLGSSEETAQSARADSEEEKQRIARLARFDKRNLLDDMKED